MPTPPTGSQSVQIVINGVPKGLVDQIDKLAHQEQRSRAFFVRRLLEKTVPGEFAKSGLKALAA